MSPESKGGKQGPLAGLRIVEMAGIGPAPMCAMVLADAGAEVIRIDRPSPSGLGIAKPTRFDLLTRGRRSVAVDLKHSDGVACVRDLVAQADVLVEGFRPGTMERLGLGPDVCFQIQPSLVYGRVTGFGQSGPLASAAGHDLNYIALTGALDAIGREGALPTPPLNLVGDFAGGAMYLAFGIMAAVHHARQSGVGQIVDAAMVDGAANLMTSLYGLHGAGLMSGGRGRNLLDSGAPYYETYACADGHYISVAPIEAKFRAVLLEKLGLQRSDLPDLDDPSAWHQAKEVLAARFRTRSRDEWCALLEGTDACFTPVLSMADAPRHAHNLERSVFLKIDGVVQPAPAPRFSATPSGPPSAPEREGASTRTALADWGIGQDRIEHLIEAGAIGTRHDRTKYGA